MENVKVVEATKEEREKLNNFLQSTMLPQDELLKGAKIMSEKNGRLLVKTKQGTVMTTRENYDKYNL